MLHCTTCGKDYAPDVKFCPADRTPLQADATLKGETPADPLIGQTLDGKYKLEERLGIGGMGTVYRARHVLIDRPVAVKVLHQRLVEDEASRIRFQREAKASGRLQHLNAVAVTDFGQSSTGYVYIVMELLEGHTLREILAKEAPLETARAVSLMLQASAAVAAAHEAGIIHRDLKPANILVTQSADVPSIVKVLDFGIAKLLSDAFDDDEPNLTQVGVMIGTPRYMSPEQCNGFELTPAADVYSLGVILYEMLTGVSPFNGSTPLAIALKHSTDLPKPPREMVPTIPLELEGLVLHALEKNPDDRPANAAAFRSELLEIAERLGLEHHALISVADIDSLRGAGRETPSGRLIVDISRLRESRALTSGSNEITLVSKTPQTSSEPPSEKKKLQIPIAKAPQQDLHEDFARINVKLDRRSPRRVGIVVAIAVALISMAALAYSFMLRSSNASPPVASEAVTPTPTPTQVETPSPVPSASPSVNPSPKRKPSPKADEDKKAGKVGSFMNKVKRILKKPF